MKFASYRLAALLVPFLLAPAASQAASSFECPWQPIADRPAAAVQKLLPSGDTLNDNAVIEATISQLRDHGLSSGLIVDSIISAYCPVIGAETGLTEDQKADAVKEYAIRVTDMTYTYSQADEIILDIPLPNAVASRVQSTAADAGLSVNDWVKGVIEDALVGDTP